MHTLVSYLKSFLLRAFDIREGEYQRVFFMQLNIFLIIFVLMIIKPVVTAQFLTVIGAEKLPVLFVLVAVCAMVVSTLYSRALNKRSLRRMTSITLSISVVVLLLIGVLLFFNIAERPVLYIFYVGVAIFGVLTTSQFWIMANLSFNAREAKRLFGFIGAGPIAGGVVGGYFTSLMAGFLEGPQLLWTAAGILSICIPLNNFIWKKHITPLTPLQKQKRFTGFGDHPMKMIIKSKHLLYTALLVGLGVVVSKMIDFQFGSVASAAFPDPDDLTVFIAFWFSTFNVVSLLIQLFLTRKVVGTYGVGNSLFVLPGGILLGSVALVFSPILVAGVFTKLWDVSVRQSVNKAATELLILPIPAQIKSKAKSFIDVFVDMAATGVGGILLIVVVNGLDLSVSAVGVLTILLLGLWIWVVTRVRKEYLQTFRSKLKKADEDPSKHIPDLSSASVLNGLRRALETGSDPQVLYVLRKVKEIQDPRLYENVSQHLSHTNPSIRAAALDCVYFLREPIQETLLDKLLSDPDLEVRILAHNQLFFQRKNDREKLIREKLADPDPGVRYPVLVSLTAEYRNSTAMISLYSLEEHVGQLVRYINTLTDPEDIILYKKLAVRAIGNSQLATYYSFIYDLLEDPDLDVVNEAIRSAGQTMYPNFIPRLTRYLVGKQTRVAATEALLFYGVGVIEELRTIVLDPESNSEVIRKIPAVIKQIEAQRSVDVLLEFLNQPDVMLRLESLRALNTVQQEYPYLLIPKEEVIGHLYDEIHLYKEILGIFYQQQRQVDQEVSEELRSARSSLTELLERRMDGTVERIFRLLGLSYPPDDVIPVYNGIRSINPQERLDSVEFLDNLLEPSLKRALMPVAETFILDSVSDKQIDQLKVELKREKDCLELLLQGRDPKLKSAVFHLISQLQDREYLPLILPLRSHPLPRIREQANELCKQMEALP